MIDDADGRVTMLSDRWQVARKTHICHECKREIEPGEQYRNERFKWDGAVSTHKTCRHCMAVRDWLMGECGGWIYGYVEEDLHEHATSGCYPMYVLRMAVGMRWKWRTPRNRLMPIPKITEDAA